MLLRLRTWFCVVAPLLCGATPLEQCPSAAGCWRSGGAQVAAGGFVCERSRLTPPGSCRFPLLALRTWGAAASFRAGFVAGPGADGARRAPKEYRGGSVFRMWNVSVAAGGDGGAGGAAPTWPPRCAATLSGAVLFTIPYGARYAGKSNYYHMHVDVLLPLMALLDERQRRRAARGLDGASGDGACSAAAALMPAPGQRAPTDAACGREGAGAAEPLLLPAVSELYWPLEDVDAAPGAIDWGTDAFADGASYWVAALQAMSGAGLLPFTAGALGALLRGRYAGGAAGRGEAGALCLRDAVLGLPGSGTVPEDGPELLARHVRARLHLPLVQLVMPTRRGVLPRVALVSRRGRRTILNEQELLLAAGRRLAARVEPLRFASMPFAAQVAAMADVAVLVGMQGAGMTNGLFLPMDATAVVLYEFGAVEDLFAELLRPRGPYLAWVNEHEGNSVCNKTVDRFCDSPDTIVDVGEFLVLLAKALKLSGAKTVFRKKTKTAPQ